MADPLSLLLTITMMASPAIADIVRRLRQVARERGSSDPEMARLMEELADKVAQSQPKVAQQIRDAQDDPRFIALIAADSSELPSLTAVMQMQAAERTNAQLTRWSRWLVVVTLLLVLATIALVVTPFIHDDRPVVNNILPTSIRCR